MREFVKKLIHVILTINLPDLEKEISQFSSDIRNFETQLRCLNSSKRFATPDQLQVAQDKITQLETRKKETEEKLKRYQIAAQFLQQRSTTEELPREETELYLPLSAWFSNRNTEEDQVCAKVCDQYELEEVAAPKVEKELAHLSEKLKFIELKGLIPLLHKEENPYRFMAFVRLLLEKISPQELFKSGLFHRYHDYHINEDENIRIFAQLLKFFSTFNDTCKALFDLLNQEPPTHSFQELNFREENEGRFRTINLLRERFFHEVEIVPTILPNPNPTVVFKLDDCLSTAQMRGKVKTLFSLFKEGLIESLSLKDASHEFIFSVLIDVDELGYTKLAENVQNGFIDDGQIGRVSSLLPIYMTEEFLNKHPTFLVFLAYFSEFDPSPALMTLFSTQLQQRVIRPPLKLCISYYAELKNRALSFSGEEEFKIYLLDVYLAARVSNQEEDLLDGRIRGIGPYLEDVTRTRVRTLTADFFQHFTDYDTVEVLWRERLVSITKLNALLSSPLSFFDQYQIKAIYIANKQPPFKLPDLLEEVCPNNPVQKVYVLAVLLFDQSITVQGDLRRDIIHYISQEKLWGNLLLHVLKQRIDCDYEVIFQHLGELDYKAELRTEIEPYIQQNSNLRRLVIPTQAGLTLLAYYQTECQRHIARLEKINSPAALEKKSIFENGLKHLATGCVEIRLKQFKQYMRDNAAVLQKPHSSIAKDILKGIIVFLASLLLVVPGVFLGIRFFSFQRRTQSGDFIKQVEAERVPVRP